MEVCKVKKFLVYGIAFLISTQIAAYASYSFDGIDEVRNYIFADEVENTAKKISMPNANQNQEIIINKTKKIDKLKKQLEVQQQKVIDIENQIKELENK